LQPQETAHTPTVLGYLLGPTLGASLFSLTHRSIFRGNPAPFEVMDRAFFEHIKRNRVSPVFQSVNNPSPDYYGEKVSAGRRP
jgi:import inner membrane translocase subunit TIM23